MKTTVIASDLARGLATVRKTVMSTSTLAVLGNVLIATNGNEDLILSGSDLEVMQRVHVPAVKMAATGETTVPAHLLHELVKSLPSDAEVSLNLEDHGVLNVVCGATEANLKCISADEFPVYDSVGAAGLALSGPDIDALAEGIAQIVPCASKEDSRPVLNAVLVRLEPGLVTLCGADGYRLGVRTVHLESPMQSGVWGEDGKARDLLVPRRAMELLLALLATDAGGHMTIRVPSDYRRVAFDLSGALLASQLIEGRYPDYGSILPKSHSTRVIVGTRDLARALRTTGVIARDAANITRWAIGGDDHPDRVAISATSAEMGNACSEVEAQIEGDPLEVAFNYAFVRELLGTMPSEQVAIELTLPSAPAVFRPAGDEPDDLAYAVMPMVIRS